MNNLQQSSVDHQISISTQPIPNEATMRILKDELRRELRQIISAEITNTFTKLIKEEVIRVRDTSTTAREVDPQNDEYSPYKPLPYGISIKYPSQVVKKKKPLSKSKSVI